MPAKSTMPTLTGELIQAPPRRAKALATPQFAANIGKGRPPGAQNKVQKGAKDMLEACFQKIGGLAEFARWARANQNDFYKLWGRTLAVTAKEPTGMQTPVVYVNISQRDAML